MTVVFTGAEVPRGQDVAPLAHAVPDFGAITASRGMALCEQFLAEELVLLPELPWEEVSDDHRCPECARIWRQMVKPGGRSPLTLPTVDAPASSTSADAAPIGGDAPASLALRLVVDGPAAAVASVLIRAMYLRGFDLLRRVSLVFVLDFAERREPAYAALESVKYADWDTALYGDSSGWVLRMGRNGLVTYEGALADITDVKALAARFAGRIRGLTVEDLQTEDVWGQLESRLLGASRRPGEAATVDERPRRSRGLRP